MVYLWVFIGGGMGSICRFAISKLLLSNSVNFPWGTFVANLLACIVLGALVSSNQKGLLKPTYQLLLMTGFCGGFSTFSTFSLESLLLLQNGQYLSAFAYVFGSFLFGILGLYLGIKLWA